MPYMPLFGVLGQVETPAIEYYWGFLGTYSSDQFIEDDSDYCAMCDGAIDAQAFLNENYEASNYVGMIFLIVDGNQMYHYFEVLWI